jgi:hypothetical protein
MFGLLKSNMQALYEGCKEWGWKEKEKKRELLVVPVHVPKLWLLCSSLSVHCCRIERRITFPHRLQKHQTCIVSRLSMPLMAHSIAMNGIDRVC